MKRWKPLIVIFLLATIQPFAQRALPGFTVKELGKGKISISWINPYPSCNQLAVQRSTDSINFRTIFSAQSPELPGNGYVDTKVPVAPKVYYRIFYVLKGGNYFFTAAKKTEDISSTTETVYSESDIATRIDLPKEKEPEGKDSINTDKINLPEKTFHIYKRGKPAFQFSAAGYRQFRDSIVRFTKDSLALIQPGEIDWRPFIPQPKEYVSVFVKDTLLIQVEADWYKRFKDSIVNNTKDTLYQITAFRAELSRYVPKPSWKPSVYVYTNNFGYLNISLPANDYHAYHVIFFDAEGKELFRIQKMKEAELILDKANFKRGGWYEFELYHHNKLVERNKFFLQKN